MQPHSLPPHHRICRHPQPKHVAHGHVLHTVNAASQDSNLLCTPVSPATSPPEDIVKTSSELSAKRTKNESEGTKRTQPAGQQANAAQKLKKKNEQNLSKRRDGVDLAKVTERRRGSSPILQDTHSNVAAPSTREQQQEPRTPRAPRQRSSIPADPESSNITKNYPRM